MKTFFMSSLALAALALVLGAPIDANAKAAHNGVKPQPVLKITNPKTFKLK